jgi:radical SAM protein with 4Fe4S-binding SPASM domain
VLDELAGLGGLIVVFTGGEVFLRRDNLELVSDARERGFAVVLFTNGSQMSETIARRLHDLAVLGVEVSLRGGNAATHDAVTGVPGSFAHACRAVELLRRNSVRVKIKCNLIRSNRGDTVDQVIALARELDAEYTFDPGIFPRRDGNTVPTRERLDAEALMEVYCDARIGRRFNWTDPHSQVEQADGRLCGAGRNTMAIGPDGSVYPCVPLRIAAGNVRQTPLASIWRDAPIFARLRSLTNKDLEPCGACDLRRFCGRCSAMAHNETGNLLGCAPMVRTIAGVKKRIFESGVMGGAPVREMADATC